MLINIMCVMSHDSLYEHFVCSFRSLTVACIVQVAFFEQWHTPMSKRDFASFNDFKRKSVFVCCLHFFGRWKATGSSQLTLEEILYIKNEYVYSFLICIFNMLYQKFINNN